MNRCALVAALAIASVQLTVCERTHAQTVENFYKGKQIRMIVGHPAGGDYDLGGRLLAKYLGAHIPGKPTIVVQNMPGAASVVATNDLYNIAPKDGTIFGSFSRNIPSQAALGQASIEADPRRFNWLGATSRQSHVCISRKDSPIATAQDVFNHELIVPGAGPSSALSIIPLVLNNVIATKFHVVEGYNGFPEALNALERGEVEGLCNAFEEIEARKDLIRDGTIRILFHTEENPLPGEPDIPSIFSFIKDDKQAQLLRFVFSSVEFGRPYVLPPGVPQERVEVLREAFKAATEDPALIAEAKQTGLDMTYTSPDELLALVNKLYATPADQLDVVRKLLPEGGG
ncbi:MAG TPA: tripartite tricarboxylate transporter substrate-binding protein [Beijerinckiaceae bacterium]|nr:tripartite tricarboxylate transporter substrate-binding protein [Beijerinckiaceae bacterium]